MSEQSYSFNYSQAENTQRPSKRITSTAKTISRELLKKIMLENLLSSNASAQDLNRAFHVLQRLKQKRNANTRISPISLN